MCTNETMQESEINTGNRKVQLAHPIFTQYMSENFKKHKYVQNIQLSEIKFTIYIHWQTCIN